MEAVGLEPQGGAEVLPRGMVLATLAVAEILIDAAAKVRAAHQEGKLVLRCAAVKGW